MSETVTTPASAPANTSDLDIPPWERPDPGQPAAPERSEPDKPPPDADPKPEPETKPEPEEETAEQKVRARLAFEAREAKREAREARQAMEQLQRQIAQAQGQGQGQETEEQRIDRLAEEKAALKEFNRECNRIYEAGVKDIPDFQQALAGFAEIGGLTRPLIEAAAEAGEPHKILAYLGRNPDEAEAINRLPPHRMGAAVARIAAKATEAPPPPRTVSRAPPPIRAINGAARGEPDPDKMSMDEWMEREEKRERERRRY